MFMSIARQIRIGTVAVLVAAVTGAAVAGSAQVSALRLDSSRIVVAGSSNVHAWTAATTAAKVTRVQWADGSDIASPADAIANPAALRAFELVIPAASLTSPREGIDKNMHKALKVQQHASITFRLARLEPVDAGTLRATGLLTVAGVEREVVLPLTVTYAAAVVTVRGSVDLVMTDFGIEPPKAMLGMLKTNPKVTVQFEAVLSTPQS